MRFRDPQPLLRAVKMDGPNCLLMSQHVQTIYTAVAESMSELTSLFFNAKHAREILSYFPYERGYIAEGIEIEEIDDAEVTSTIAISLQAYVFHDFYHPQTYGGSTV